MSKLNEWRQMRTEGDKTLWHLETKDGHKLSRWCPKDEIPGKIGEVGKKVEKTEIEDTKMEVEEKKDEPKYEFKIARSGTCDRCHEDVKYPSPECKRAECVENKATIQFDRYGVMKCSNCADTLKPFGANCPGCSYYIPAPGETFDASRVNFDLPGIIGGSAGGAILLATNKHDMPCPSQTVEDISKDPAVNEWVFNHLPLKQEQKDQLLTQLTQDQRRMDILEERESKGEELKKKEGNRLKTLRLQPSKLERQESGRSHPKDSQSHWVPKEKEDVHPPSPV